VRRFFLARVAGVAGKGMIKRLAEDILRVVGQVPPDRRRQVGVIGVRHRIQLSRTEVSVL